jgi:hypothetical protein
MMATAAAAAAAAALRRVWEENAGKKIGKGWQQEQKQKQTTM